jgi:leucyl aminopeptidase
MRLVLSDTPPEQYACDLLALPVPEPGTLAGEAADVDRAVGGRLAEIARAEGFSGKPNRTVLLQCPDGPARRILLVGVGRDPTPERLRRFGGTATRRARDLRAARVALTTSVGGGTSHSPEDVRAVAEGAGLGAYRFERYRKPEDGAEVDEAVVIARRGDRKALERAVAAADVAVRATSSTSRPMC